MSKEHEEWREHGKERENLVEGEVVHKRVAQKSEIKKNRGTKGQRKADKGQFSSFLESIAVSMICKHLQMHSQH